MDENKALDETAAGVVVASGLHHLFEDYKLQLATLQANIKHILKERDNRRRAGIAEHQS